MSRFWAVAAAILVFVTSATALAQHREAVGHLAAGRVAAARRNWSAALGEFQAAEAADDSLEALEGIADAEYHLGRFGEAYEAYLAVQESLDRFRLDRRERATRRASVERRLGELTTRTGSVNLVVDGTGGKVFLDDRALGPAPLRTSVRVTPGTHRVRIETGDGSGQSRSVDVVAGATATLEMQVASTGTPSEAPTTATTAPTAPTTAPEAPKPGSPAPAATPAPGEPRKVPQLVAVRAKKAPNIDGYLDDAVWTEAPAASQFLSGRSTPYGQPSAEPTSVQLAYDEEYLYVAFRCGYSSQRARDDAFPTDEQGALTDAESVAVTIDPLRDGANALLFLATRAGARADEEVTANGDEENADWRAIWDVEVKRSQAVWTAEFRIPWGTLRIPRHDEPFSIGINFVRREPTVGERSFWSLPLDGGANYDPTFFGTVQGLQAIRPGLRLYLQPYVAVAYDQQRAASTSRLLDLTGTQGNFRTYAGAYARYYPPGPVRFEATANPDFAAVPPDQAVANFNRYELIYPEVRPFFSEDNPRFIFGDDDETADPIDPQAQLFYSRRIGLITDPRTGATTPVPIIYGAKTVVRTDATEVAAMNVALSSANPAITLNDNVGVLRFNENFGEGNRIGGMLLGRRGQVSSYSAGGVDGAFTLYDRRLTLDGFVARTATEGAPSSGMGEARLFWASANFLLLFSYLDIGSAFDSQLGYVPVSGVRTTWFTVGYRNLLNTDEQKKIWFYAGINDTKDRNDVLVYDHAFARAILSLSNGSIISITALPSIENVTATFPLFGGRINVTPGRYDEMVVQGGVTTAARRPVVAGVYYQAGDLFGGQQQSPSGTLELNLGRFSSNTTYAFYWIRYNGQELYGHQVSSATAYSYSPLARTSLVVQANSLIDRAVAQLVTSYTFGLLSTLVLTVSKSTGANNVPANQWTGNAAPFSAILSFAYGVSPF